MEGVAKKEVVFTERPLLKKIMLFSLPIVFTGLLQLLYNAADIIVLGQFAGHEQMAAVGSTGSLVNLITNLFLGLSVGTLAAMSKWVGAKNRENAQKVAHTAVIISLLAGVLIGIFGFFMSRQFLQWMSSPDALLPLSTQYLQIFFIGMPFNLLYNFGSSLMRACGDTKRPLIALSFAGIANIALNLLLVIVFKMGVSGVAIATVISQAISSILVVYWLMKRDGYAKLSIKKMRIDKKSLLEIIKIGLPAGMQGTIFSISNVIIQSSINLFGEFAIAGNTAAANIEGFVYTSMNSISQTCLTFTGQNYGANKPKNINTVLIQCSVIVTAIGMVMGGLAFVFGNMLCGIYNTDPEVIAFGVTRLLYISVPYFLCGMMEVIVGSLRGIGYSVLPFIVSVIGVCGVRIVWIFTVFAAAPALPLLYISYPVSWLMTALMHFLCYLVISKRVFKRMEKNTETISP